MHLEPIELKTDLHGQVLLPHHDGHLLGVAIESKVCELRYQSTDGLIRVVQLKKACAMDVSNFREGNIILSMMVIPAEQAMATAEEEALRRLGWGELPELKGKFLFVLESSYGYGADIVADCDDVCFFVERQ